MKFEIYANDIPQAEAFILEHENKCFKDENGEWKYLGAIGGGLTYSFTPTSIGVVASVKCSICKEKITLVGSL